MSINSNIHRPDNVPLGVATIVGTVLALSLGDALIKSLGGGGGMGLWQLFAVRSLLAFPVLLGSALVFLNRRDRNATATRPRGAVVTLTFLPGRRGITEPCLRPGLSLQMRPVHELAAAVESD